MTDVMLLGRGVIALSDTWFVVDRESKEWELASASGQTREFHRSEGS